MQWLMLFGWGMLAIYGGQNHARAAFVRCLMTAGLAVSMLSQLYLLWLDGLFSLATALPLHLCSLMGVLSVPLLWRAPSWLMEFSLLLGAPCAFLALCFPAILTSPWPLLMSLSFYRLHVLIICVPLFCLRMGKPLPAKPQRTFCIGNGYLLMVSLFNHFFLTNYLFLQRAPQGTPLAWLFLRGGAFYVCALELLCMLLMLWLAYGYRRMAALRTSFLIAKST
ncbi:MAG: YwaF family protein [Clostridia bacterium]